MLIEKINETNLTGNERKKYRRKKKILDLLYHNEILSGPVICKKLGVSLPTALVLINELISSKFVEVRGRGISKGGRKPTMFGLSSNSIFVIACELGRYQGKMAIYNSHNEVVSPLERFHTNIDDSELTEKIYSTSQKLIQATNIDEHRIFGIGLTMPGLIDEKLGINYTVKKQNLRNIKERLENKFNKLVYINNDARMQAYGEYIFGMARGHKNAIVINLSWGLGVGMIIDGKLYNGSTGFAGELAHTRFVEDGDLCICGKRGCLETVVSVNSLIKNAQKGIIDGKISQLTNRFAQNHQNLNPEDIILAARAGDEFSISLLNSIGIALGKALSVTIQLINPEIIVLGGIISAANQFILTPIQQSLNRYCLEQISENTKIVVSENWEQSGLLGVTAMLYQKLFSDMYK